MAASIEAARASARRRGLGGVVVAMLAAGLASAAPAGSPGASALAPPGMYVVDLVATTSRGTDMNDAGDVIGTSYPDPGCGSGCLPPLETVAWRHGVRIVLPSLPGYTGITVAGINNQGWVAGFAGDPSVTSHALVWKPNGNTYTAIDLGLLPGTVRSVASGIDDLGRVVGWSTTASFPYNGSPFLWTESGGMVDLSSQGFPDEAPLGISPGGTVATHGYWYHLDDPASVSALATPPTGYLVQNSRVAINDAGDQARFLVRTGSQNLVYPFRYHHDGQWQQLSTAGTGHLSSYGVGGINAAGDVTLTVQGSGQIAYGPDGLAQPLAPLVSPAHGGGAITSVGAMKASGHILAEMIIGQSGRRLVRLVPGRACAANCIRVASIEMSGQGPAFCDQGSASATARLTVRDENGVSLPGVTVSARFFDDYWLDEPVVGTTNAQGQATFQHVGPPCVGAIAILVTRATRHPSPTAKSFLDRTTGVLTSYVIPLPPAASQRGSSRR